MKTIQIFLFLALSQLLFSQKDEYMKVVAEPPSTAFVMYAANNGDLYYIRHEKGYLDLMKYELSSDEVTEVSSNFVSDTYENYQYYNNGFGAIATTPGRDTVYCITTCGSNHGHGSDLFRLVCSTDEFEHITTLCGTNLWMYWNVSLSPDGESIYYVSNNTPSGKKVHMIDLATKECEAVFNLDNILGTRELCFGGINVWDKNNNFYVPVWSTEASDDDCALLQVQTGSDVVSAKLIHPTVDGTASGTKLFPGFRHESCWNAICASSLGNIYLCISNHYHPKSASDPHGNVAFYKYEPGTDEILLLGDMKSVSEKANNWMEHESQYKVHTYMIQNSDDKIYFASGEHDPAYFLRGSHIYTINIHTDEVEDYSKSQNYLMDRNLSVIENDTEASSTSGVFIEHYGIKGIALNPNYPQLLYAMTWEMENSKYLQSYIIKYRIDGNHTTMIDDIIPTNSNPDKINVFPNPFGNGPVTFDLSQLTVKSGGIIRIFDIYGHLMYFENLISSEQYILAIPETNSNVLFYTLEIGKQKFSGKLIK